MIKKSILTIATISAGLFLSSNVQALDSPPGKDRHAQPGVETTHNKKDQPTQNKKNLEHKRERKEDHKTK